MAVENTTNIAGLDDTLPTGTDTKSEGDNHLRLIKTVLKHVFAGFPGEVMLAAAEAQGATVNDYVLTVAPAPAAYAANTVVVFRANHANTAGATLKVGALAAKALLNPEGTALRANAITATTWVLAIYDGTNFRMIGGGNSQAIYDYANQLAFQAALPLQTGNAGKFLQTDGADASWQLALPAQTGNQGKYLLTDGTSAAWGFLPPEHGQCRFVFVSATEWRLMPLNGNGLVINGRQYRIPAGGIPLPISAVAGANGTSNYVYAKDDGSGEIALEGVVTGHTTHSDGVEIKTGDSTRTLVGVVYKNASGQFQFNDSVRGGSSWFNRQYPSAQATNFSTGTASPTPVEAVAGVNVWCWEGEGAQVQINGRMSVNIAGALSTVYMYVDGTQVWSTSGTSVAANASLPFAIALPLKSLAEGFHYVSTWLAASGGSTSSVAVTEFITATPSIV